MDVNFDPSCDAKELTREAGRNGDLYRPVCYRGGDAGRVWIPEERRLRAIVGRNQRLGVGATAGAEAEAIYAQAGARADVETPEPLSAAPGCGAVVYEDIAIYAHAGAVRDALGTPRRVTVFSEQESAIRSAVFAAWRDLILAKQCEAFFIRINKSLTTKEKQQAGAGGRAALKTAKRRHKCNGLRARRALATAAMKHLAPRGQFRDRWGRHPVETAFEPEKEIARTTRRREEENETRRRQVVDGYAFASLHNVDRFFMQLRYAINQLDRARVSGRTHGAKSTQGAGAPRDDKWDVYHLYNPGNVQILLDLHRFWWNWCAVGEDDGETPAMRLGVADKPLDLADALEAAGEDLARVRAIQEAIAQQTDARRSRQAV